MNTAPYPSSSDVCWSREQRHQLHGPGGTPTGGVSGSSSPDSLTCWEEALPEGMGHVTWCQERHFGIAQDILGCLEEEQKAGNGRECVSPQCMRLHTSVCKGIGATGAHMPRCQNWGGPGPSYWADCVSPATGGIHIWYAHMCKFSTNVLHPEQTHYCLDLGTRSCSCFASVGLLDLETPIKSNLISTCKFLFVCWPLLFLPVQDACTLLLFFLALPVRICFLSLCCSF